LSLSWYNGTQRDKFDLAIVHDGGGRTMDFDTYKRMRVSAPMYGIAPAGLIAEHQKIVQEMDWLYRSGVPLTSERYAELNERANEISNKITSYNAPTEKSPNET